MRKNDVKADNNTWPGLGPDPQSPKHDVAWGSATAGEEHLADLRAAGVPQRASRALVIGATAAIAAGAAALVFHALSVAESVAADDGSQGGARHWTTAAREGSLHRDRGSPSSQGIFPPREESAVSVDVPGRLGGAGPESREPSLAPSAPPPPVVEPRPEESTARASMVAAPAGFEDLDLHFSAKAIGPR